jgi:hypothetical protein
MIDCEYDSKSFPSKWCKKGASTPARQFNSRKYLERAVLSSEKNRSDAQNVELGIILPRGLRLAISGRIYLRRHGRVLIPMVRISELATWSVIVQLLRL